MGLAKIGEDYGKTAKNACNDCDGESNLLGRPSSTG
jgi:hypothetical protein